jgi:hypothetical protein
MTDDRGVVHTVSWRDLCPWVILPRAFGAALHVPLLFLAIVALVITPLGWRASEFVFRPVKELPLDAAPVEFETQPMLGNVVAFNRSWPGSRSAYNPLREGAVTPRDTVGSLWYTMSEPVMVFDYFTLSFRNLFDVRLSLSQFAYFFFGGLWTLLVWGFFGGAITRMAAVQLGREERIGLVEAVRFAARKLVHYVVAPLAPLAVIALLTLFIVPLGWLLNLDVGVVLVGLIWFLVLLAGFVMAVLLLGLLFGWPLMWGTISTEGSDALDAVSRSYSYVYQRPLHYLFYGAMAVLLGTLVWWLIAWFSQTIVDMSFWAASWGMGTERLDEIFRVMIAPPTSEVPPEFLYGPGVEPPSTALRIGTGLLAFWIGLVRTIAAAVGFAFFWCLTSAVYLLLRRDVDQTEFDEVYVEEEEDRYGLPPLTIDRAGVPTVAPESTPDASPGGATPGESSDGGNDPATPPPLDGKSGDRLPDDTPPENDESQAGA